ncbi:phosphopantothenoylcysteine decarboxylase/phosphopantothenate--cysteine ligase [Thermocatellispora tengchongensis]|uniref:Phosphopantothenoylcysteine decarboxylase/phosphopantothenate--cysteine ligase n=1 Tax=Thermocatellispora tengchongensis TaxID=1073253 RepID=A0A840PMP3_9ACTN|nr:flavoprotein [Thermocatellispora tengchongensis]MBB5139283.1 phosphopantothenoylcysteine decarboxylase/phosphopantothenate--cysteine ligase [Thermocatellispora tengchongensis]
MIEECDTPTSEPGVSRLLLVCAGSAYASSMPYWLDLLRMQYPRLAVKVVVTRSAERFVTRQALGGRLATDVLLDAWPGEEATARHVEWADWAEAVVVYPATLQFMARLALGLADTPALLAAQCTNAPVVVAPALPPGGLESAACRQHWAALAARPNIVLIPPGRGRSLFTGRDDAWVPPPLPEVLHLLTERLAELTAPEEPEDDGAEPSTTYGTGLLHTSIHSMATGGYRWRRAPGPFAPAPFSPLTGETRDALAAIGEVGTCRLAIGTAAGDARIYDVRGGESAARRLMRPGDHDRLEKPLHDLGRLLRAVHDQEPPADLVGRPARGLVRLGDWLAGRATSPRAAYAQGQFRQRLGEERWQRVRSWYDAVRTDTGVTLAHGAAGFGALAIDGESGAGDLLIGEDVCAAPWYLDVGWLIGELAELQWQVGGDQHGWQALINALFEGYDRDLGPEWNRYAALRILLHVHDIAAYFAGYQYDFDHYRKFLQYLIDL